MVLTATMLMLRRRHAVNNSNQLISRSDIPGRFLVCDDCVWLVTPALRAEFVFVGAIGMHGAG